MLMQRLAPADEAFVSLATALDPVAAGGALARALTVAGFPTVELSASVARVRHKPGRKALIGYELRGTEQNGKAIRQMLMLSLWPDGEPSRLPDIGIDAHARPDFGPPRLSIDELGGEAWFFPNDRKIAHLPQLLAEAGEFGEEAEVVHYVPEQGCTVRVRTKHGTVFGKVRADDRGETAVRVSCLAGARPHAAVRLAPILRSDLPHRIQWQVEVAGGPVNVAALLDEPRLWADRIACALAAFHALPAPVGLPRISPDAIVQSVTRRIACVAPAMPELSRGLDMVIEELARLVPSDCGFALSHGDLHADNLLWDGASFAVIDLDTCALASPARDHAGLAAALAAKASASGAAPSEIAAMIAALRDSARAHGVPSRQFDWFLAASLLGERIYRSATRLKPVPNRQRRQLLDLARMHISQCERSYV